MQSIEWDLYFPFITPLKMFFKGLGLCLQQMFTKSQMHKRQDICLLLPYIYIFYCPKFLIKDSFSKSSPQLNIDVIAVEFLIPTLML